MSILIGIFRCILPYRYWSEPPRGAIASAILTILLSFPIGFLGFLSYAGKAADTSASQILELANRPRDKTTGVILDKPIRIVNSNIVTPLLFFLTTAEGLFVSYLYCSGTFRLLTVAGGDPYGDPILTLLDRMARSSWSRIRLGSRAYQREKAEGPPVPDRIVEGHRFDGKGADYVLISSRVKEGWTAGTVLRVDAYRLRLGDPYEVSIEGRLRTCYPLSLACDGRIDRRFLFYRWPSDAPPLPDMPE